MNRIVGSIRSSIVIFLLLLNTACDNDELQEKTPEPTQPTDSLGTMMTASTEVKQSEIVVLTIEGYTLTDSVYNGSIGDLDISLFRHHQQELVFILPSQLGAGQFELATDIASNTLVFNVTEVPLDDTPEDIISGFIGNEVEAVFDGFEATAQSLNEQGLITADEIETIAANKAELQELLAQFKNLSSVEKEATAQFLVTNMGMLDEFLSIVSDLNGIPSPDNGRLKNSCENPVYKIDKIRCKAMLMIDGAVVLASGWAAASLSATGLGTVLGLAILTKVTIPAAMSFRHNLLMLTNSEIKAEKIISEFPSSGRVKTETQVVPGEPYPVNLKILKTNLQESDRESNVPWVSQSINAFGNFQNSWETIRTIAGKGLSALDFPDSTGIHEHAETMDFLSVRVLDRNDILATLSGEVENIVVTFTGQGDGQFEYLYTYNDGTFNANSDTLTAVITDSTAFSFIIDGIAYAGTGTRYNFNKTGGYYAPSSGSVYGPCGEGDSYSKYIGGAVCDDAGVCTEFWFDISNASYGGSCGDSELIERTYSYTPTTDCDEACIPRLSWVHASRSGVFEYDRPEGNASVVITSITDHYISGYFSFSGCELKEVDNAIDSEGKRLYCEEDDYYCCKTQHSVSGTFKVRKKTSL